MLEQKGCCDDSSDVARVSSIAAFRLFCHHHPATHDGVGVQHSFEPFPPPLRTCSTAARAAV